MDTYFYYYKINYYDDLKERTATGITYGKNWEEAINHLTSYYGENYLSELIYFGIIDNDGSDCLEIQDLNEILKKVAKQEDEEC